jgi:hypothetical protein
MGQQRIVLPDGAELRGRLLIDGQPGADWPLRLLLDRELPSMPPSLAKLVRDSLWQSPIRTAADGTFACQSIPVGAKVTLFVKKPLLLLPESGGARDREEAMQVVADGGRVDVQTTLLPNFTVRVLWADNGAPVAGAVVTGQAKFANGEMGGSGAATERAGIYHLGFGPCSPEGYASFCDLARRPRLVNALIEVSAPDSAGDTRQMVEADDLKLGQPIVVRLPRAKVTHFVAVDGAGRAIAGARAQALGISAPTDAAGRGTFVGTSTDLRGIGSPLHLVRAQAPRAPANGTQNDPYIYVLERDNTLRIRLLDERGEPFVVEASSGIRVAVEADDWLLAGDRYHLALDEQLHGFAAHNSGQKETQPRVSGAEAIVRSLTPGRACTIVVRDMFGDMVGRAPTRTPEFGAEVVVAVTVAVASFARRLAVVDTDGRPIVGAGIGQPVILGSRWRAGADGTVEVCGHAARASMDAAVVAPGFASQRLTVDLRSREPLVIRLQRGHVVTVHVVDERGAPVDTYPWLFGNDLDDISENVGPGCRRYASLPLGKVTFACGIGAARFYVEHDTQQPDALLRVPRPGQLRVVGTAWPVPGEGRFLVAVARRIDADGPPTEVRQPNLAPETALQPLVPGRYRVTLVARSPGDTASREPDRELWHTDVDVRAGETTIATVR